jgi:hypothetical protein
MIDDDDDLHRTRPLYIMICTVVLGVHAYNSTCMHGIRYT